MPGAVNKGQTKYTTLTADSPNHTKSNTAWEHSLTHLWNAWEAVLAHVKLSQAGEVGQGVRQVDKTIAD